MLSVKLKELRKKHALTQEQLAEKLNVSRQAVAKWESGAGMPDIENLKNISLVFHVSTDSLLDVRIEKDITLKNKFTIIEICLFALGISLGIVAQSFQFGFVMAILLPGIVHSIELTTLERKYRKEGNTLSERETITAQLPRDFFGRILNTDIQSKKQRMKAYMINSAILSGFLTLFRIVGAISRTDYAPAFNLLENRNFDIILGYIIGFLCSFFPILLFECILKEHIIKKYNRIGKD